MTDTPTAADTCLICAMEDADDDRIVFRDDLWAAEIVLGYEVPGWFILRVRRHAERITGLNTDELSTFAQRARDLVAAVSQVTGTPTTYLLVFGENYPHFHVLVAARGDDVPTDRRAGDIMKLRLENADFRAAVEMLPAVRDSYQRLATTAPVV